MIQNFLICKHSVIQNDNNNLNKIILNSSFTNYFNIIYFTLFLINKKYFKKDQNWKNGIDFEGENKKDDLSAKKRNQTKFFEKKLHEEKIEELNFYEKKIDLNKSFKKLGKKNKSIASEKNIQV